MKYCWRNMIYGSRRMIYLHCKHDIISVPSYAKRISSADQRERISLKKKPDAKASGFFFMVREGGVEPPRPEWALEPESSESTNSTTRAYFIVSWRLLNNITAKAICQHLFWHFSVFFFTSPAALVLAKKTATFLENPGIYDKMKKYDYRMERWWNWKNSKTRF